LPQMIIPVHGDGRDSLRVAQPLLGVPLAGARAAKPRSHAPFALVCLARSRSPRPIGLCCRRGYAVPPGTRRSTGLVDGTSSRKLCHPKGAAISSRSSASLPRALVLRIAYARSVAHGYQ
jgi:hypothetical protein